MADGDRAALAALIARYYRAEIGRLMGHAEHWHANGKPLAVHHRINKANAYFQVVHLMEGEDPFGTMERELARPPMKPPGAYPPSREIAQFSDAVVAVEAFKAGKP